MRAAAIVQRGRGRRTRGHSRYTCSEGRAAAAKGPALWRALRYRDSPTPSFRPLALHRPPCRIRRGLHSPLCSLLPTSLLSSLCFLLRLQLLSTSFFLSLSLSLSLPLSFSPSLPLSLSPSPSPSSPRPLFLPPSLTLSPSPSFCPFESSHTSNQAILRINPYSPDPRCLAEGQARGDGGWRGVCPRRGRGAQQRASVARSTSWGAMTTGQGKWMRSFACSWRRMPRCQKMEETLPYFRLSTGNKTPEPSILTPGKPQTIDTRRMARPPNAQS